VTRADIHCAVLVAANVLGVGVLFLPWTATSVAGEAALAGWLYLIVCGGLLVFSLAAASRAGETVGQGAPKLAERFLGEPSGRAVRGFYAVGVTVGQAVVALVAAGFLAQATGLGRSADGPWWMAALTISGATAIAATGWRIPPGLALPLFAVILAVLLAFVLITHRGGAEVPGLDVGWHPALSAAVLQLFVVVGWESTPAIMARTGASRTRGPLAGLGLVAVVYAAALVLAAGSRTVESSPHLALPDLGPGSGRAVAAVALLITVLFCGRNLSTAAALAAEAVTGMPPTAEAARRWVVTAGALALLATALVATRRVDATDLLSVPNTMALLVFLTVAGCLVRAGRRLSGALPLAAHLPLLFCTGPALALPVMVAAAAIGRAGPARPTPTVPACAAAQLLPISQENP
jgi:hypothetical protein